MNSSDFPQPMTAKATFSPSLTSDPAKTAIRIPVDQNPAPRLAPKTTKKHIIRTIIAELINRVA